jgi:N-acyl-D-aspartate/D-glutamate deacylase
MAFYNMGLRLLRHVHDAAEAGREFMTVEQAVHRLTGELADWYRLDAGHLRIGDRADVAIIDPAHLDASLDAHAEETVEHYDDLPRMVNRNDATVTAVLVGGRTVFANGEATDLVGRQRTGRFLRASHKSPALPTEKGELTSVG